MKAYDCQQGTEEWFRLRAGKVTASGLADALAIRKINPNKGESTEARKGYIAEIVAETLSGEPDMEGYISQSMKDGNEYEPFARAAYEVKYDVSVDKVGFVVHPTIERFGASPDGLMESLGGGLEIKCPKTKTHIKYLRAGVLPPDYEPQVMANLACSELEWWDFVSFGMKVAPRFQIMKVRVYRDEVRIKEIEDGVRSFLQEVDDAIGELNRMYPEEVYVPKLAPDYGELGITQADIDSMMSRY